MTPHASFARAVSFPPPEAQEATEVLFKHDRPRRIDRYIDYFGTSDAARQDDPCGEAFLDGLGKDDAE